MEAYSEKDLKLLNRTFSLVSECCVSISKEEIDLEDGVRKISEYAKNTCFSIYPHTAFTIITNPYDEHSKLYWECVRCRALLQSIYTISDIGLQELNNTENPEASLYLHNTIAAITQLLFTWKEG